MTMLEQSKMLLEDCLAVRPGEQVLIVTDDEKLSIGQCILQAARELGAKAILMQIRPREIPGQEPPMAVARAMASADVVIAPTVASLTHTRARIEAVAAGTRIATMPGITESMFQSGAICADYLQVASFTQRLADLLTQAQEATVIKEGLRLTLKLSGRSGVASTGIYRESGQSGNLPSGEAYIAPLEDGCDGQIQIDGSMVGIGLLESPLVATIANGRLTELSGPQSQKLAFLLEDSHRATVGELGIGTNPCARLTGNILEDEKLYGTVHIAFGTNTAFGGTNQADCHLDGVILKPDLYLDGTLILQNGAFVF